MKTNYHKLCGLKQYPFICSYFRRSEVQAQSVGLSAQGLIRLKSKCSPGLSPFLEMSKKFAFRLIQVIGIIQFHGAVGLNFPIFFWHLTPPSSIQQQQVESFLCFKQLPLLPPLLRVHMITLGYLDNPGWTCHFKIKWLITLITISEFLLPCNIMYSRA